MLLQTLSTRRALAALSTGILLLTGCSADPAHAAPGEATVGRADAWDSQGGNPTHATHSYLTEYAIDQLGAAYPELETYRAAIVEGANTEIHELPLEDANLDALRTTFGGTNAGCEHPIVVWSYASEWYREGDKHQAYWLLGLLLHYVEDMGVPAHALGVYHQSDPAHSDNFERLGLFTWAPEFEIDRQDPVAPLPSDYVAASRDWAALDFQTAWPGVTYATTFFPKTWGAMTPEQATFVQRRQARTAMVTTWALASAVSAWASAPAPAAPGEAP